MIGYFKYIYLILAIAMIACGIWVGIIEGDLVQGLLAVAIGISYAIPMFLIARKDKGNGPDAR